MEYPDLDPKGTPPGRMPGPHTALISLVVVGLLVAALIGYAVGYQAGGQKLQALESFSARIDEISQQGLIVSGLETNDINHRSQFSLQLSDKTELRWRGEPLERSDLSDGDLIMVLYRGEVTESYPAGISQVERITKLND
ncbi:MAG TPA: hypothetical protein GXZ74_04125 [Tissierellia bacterium]|nr:hypothetical protein [Tissierellia bacterium]